MSQKYVVYWCEQLRDGIEEGAKVVGSVTAAVSLINKIKGGFCGDNIEVRLFELGKEIPITAETTEVPQPAVKTTVYKVQQ